MEFSTDEIKLLFKALEFFVAEDGPNLIDEDDDDYIILEERIKKELNK